MKGVTTITIRCKHSSPTLLRTVSNTPDRIFEKEGEIEKGRDDMGKSTKESKKDRKRGRNNERKKERNRSIDRLIKRIKEKEIANDRRKRTEQLGNRERER